MAGEMDGIVRILSMGGGNSLLSAAFFAVAEFIFIFLFFKDQPMKLNPVVIRLSQHENYSVFFFMMW